MDNVESVRRQLSHVLELVVQTQGTLSKQAPSAATAPVRNVLQQAEQITRDLLGKDVPVAAIPSASVHVSQLFVSARDVLQRQQDPTAAAALASLTRAMTALHPIVLLNNAGPAVPSIRPPRAPSLPKQKAAPPASPGAERRQQPRAFLDTDISFESDSNFYTGFTEDISDGGLFVATYNLKPVGTVVEMSFRLPNGAILNIQGIVRWVREPRDEKNAPHPGIGLQFQNLSEQDKKAISDFIKAREPILYAE